MTERTTRRVRLDTPDVSRRAVPRPYYDPEAFGRFSEQIARFLGTARFLVYQTVFVAVWTSWNLLAPSVLQFDPYTFTFLTLVLSLQAAYAAPLILLAQNRQADRDRIALDEDRATSRRLQADVEYLARELASLRQAVGEVATRDFLRDQLREVAQDVVSRVGGPVDAVDEDERAARREREDRERRAERKKRKAELRSDLEPAAQERPDLGEPFVGEAAEA